jgi:lipoate-protein ligase A
MIPFVQTTMKAKGVASVPSPVDNLQKFTPAITHETFTDAVVNEFKKILGYDVLEVRRLRLGGKSC